jgi:4'-phosphopantetheinyl transferase
VSKLTCPWPVPADHPRLADDEVHVWALPLDVSARAIEIFKELLSPDELTRAARYLSSELGRRFIACRGQVRRILAAYVNASPENLRFPLGQHGKPALELAGSVADHRFNVSNSQSLALCAVTLRHEIGVDVEFVREVRDVETLARRFFAREEIDALHTLPEAERLKAFYHCWTRKEAVLKAVGAGLSIPLDQIVVSVTDSQPARVISFAGDPAGARDWWLDSLEPASGYLGAVAAPRICLKTACWQSQPEA